MDKDKEPEGDGRVHIIGMRAHAASHSHSHPDGHHTCKDVTHDHVLGTVGHTHDIGTPDEGLAHIRHVVIAQVRPFLLIFLGRPPYAYHSPSLAI